MGEIEVTEHFVNDDGKQADYPIDRINLVAGTAKKLSVRTSLEEGFDGSVMTTVQGLPPGVEVVPASETAPDDTPPLDEGDKARFLPQTSTTTLMLVARHDSPITTEPHFVRAVVTPVYPDGSLGMPLSVQSIPLMVTRPNPEDSQRNDSADWPMTKSGFSILLAMIGLGVAAPAFPADLISIRLVPKKSICGVRTLTQRVVVIGKFSDGLERDLTVQSDIPFLIRLLPESRKMAGLWLWRTGAPKSHRV